MITFDHKGGRGGQRKDHLITSWLGGLRSLDHTGLKWYFYGMQLPPNLSQHLWRGPKSDHAILEQPLIGGVHHVSYSWSTLYLVEEAVQERWTTPWSPFGGQVSGLVGGANGGQHFCEWIQGGLFHCGWTQGEFITSWQLCSLKEQVEIPSTYCLTLVKVKPVFLGFPIIISNL